MTNLPTYSPPPAPGPLLNGLRAFICTDHDGHWPIGVASVVIAMDEPQARGLLEAELVSRGLNPDEPYTLKEVGVDGPQAFILRDGNY